MKLPVVGECVLVVTDDGGAGLGGTHDLLPAPELGCEAGPERHHRRCCCSTSAPQSWDPAAAVAPSSGHNFCYMVEIAVYFPNIMD